MSNSRILSILEHIRINGKDILNFLGDITEEEFLQNKLIRNAVGMSLINIGELVKALPLEFREENPQLPWRRIAGMRDLAAHKYQTLDMRAVYNVARNRIPEIIAFVDDYLDK